MSETGLPSVEEVRTTIQKASRHVIGNKTALAIIDLFAAAVPRIQAEALREAAGHHEAMSLPGGRDVEAWLHLRADRIESEAGKQ